MQTAEMMTRLPEVAELNWRNQGRVQYEVAKRAHQKSGEGTIGAC